jgi:uncharacterized protein
MRVEWDEAKNRHNIAKHKVGFETGRLVFEDPRALSVRDRIVEGEERWQTLGMIGGVVVLLVAHSYQEEGGEEAIRIISARKATSRERRAYEKCHEESG